MTCNNDFNTILSQPNLQLIDLLDSPLLITEIRSENPKLYNYLQQDTIITELAEWSFTSKYKSNTKFINLSEKAVSVILSAVSLNELFIENEHFAKVLHDFLISDDSKNFRLCGHFYRVIGTQIKWDVPSLFINYPDIHDLLLKRIDVYSICELITLIISTNSDNILNSEKMVQDLSESADLNNDINSIYLLISILKVCISNPDLSYLFDDDIVLKRLFNVAVKTKSIVIQSDLFSYLSEIQVQPLVINDEKLIEKVTISENNINDLTISAIDIMHVPIENLVSLFFSEKATERFHKKILTKIELMNLNEFVKVVNIPNFVINIINSFGTDRWCPHCTQLILYFFNIEDYCKPLKSKKWRTFIYKKIFNVIKILNHDYGGHVPSQLGEKSNENSIDSDDSYDEDIQNLRFEEEEEFYDDVLFVYEEDGVDVENINSSDDTDEYDIDV